MASLYDAAGTYAGEDNTGPGVRSVSGLDSNKPDPTIAPASAAAAPKGNNKYTYVGLCGALNQYEKQLVATGGAEIANFYEIKFLPASMGASTIKLPGQVNKAQTPNQDDKSAQSVINSDTNSVNNQGLIRSVTSGMQILQFIEMTMRNSSYITNQQLFYKDQISGNAAPSTAVSNPGGTSWFKINMNVVPIGTTIDKIRNDYAYHITYLITPYGINQPASQFFPESKFRGAHKVYNYWFTGENTQVLHYSQRFDNLYIDMLSNVVPARVQNFPKEAEQMLALRNVRVPAPTSGQTNQGAPNGANDPASYLADTLYSQNDQKTIELKIIGDPAWISQGEIVGLNAQNFVFQGFYADGTINTDAQQAVFVVNWNRPADYNNGASGPYSGTGLMDVNASSTQGNNNNLSSISPRQSAAYAALEIKSTFSKGKFEQELKGVLLTNLNQTQLNAVPGVAETARPVTKTTAPAVRAPSFQDSNFNTGGGAATGNPKLTRQGISARATQEIPVTTPPNPPDITTPITNPTPQTTAQPNPPTSDGVVVGAAISSNSPPDAAVTVYTATGKTVAVPTPTTESVALQAGKVVVYGSGTAVTVNSKAQIMAAKDDAV